MKLAMDFEDPLAVSNGKYIDLLYVKIINPNLFVSKSTGERLPG